jgi:signal transduction histidine kinase
MSSVKTEDAVKRGFVQRATRSRPFVNLWFLLIIFLLLATSFEALVFFRWFTDLSTQINALANLQCKAAISAYKSGGPQKLESAMQQYEEESGIRAYLFDPSGRNLGGGPDRRSVLSMNRMFIRVLAQLEGKSPSAFSGRVVAQTSDHACIVVNYELEDVQVYAHRAFGFLAFLAVLCYGIAGYVLVRMHRLENAIRSFGTGKLEIRLRSNSPDPIRHLSEAFNQMASQVESQVDAHRRLCIDVSHELRSPLTRLKLAIGLARTGTHGAFGQIELEASRLNDLVDQLLDVARAEVDPTALRPERIDMESFVTEVVDECSIEARERSCEVDLRFENPGIVIGDPELLRRAIENPLRNAIRHNPPGSPVEVTCGERADFAIISVRDWGPGVPDTEIQKIFKPFYRVESDRDRNTGGSGLGLAIVERVVALHHGAVKAENAMPGLTIEIRIPRHS